MQEKTPSSLYGGKEKCPELEGNFPFLREGPPQRAKTVYELNQQNTCPTTEQTPVQKEDWSKKGHQGRKGGILKEMMRQKHETKRSHSAYCEDNS